MLPPPTRIAGTGSALVFMRSMASSTMVWMVSSPRFTAAPSSPATAPRSPISARPAATATSVAVSVSPPKTSAFSVSSKPTESGPTVTTSSPRTRLPPPSPIASTSGMRKLVRTPPTSTATADSRGKPRASTPTSVVVPPMSTTTAFSWSERKAAPRMLLVGAGGEGQHRIALDVGGAHQRAVVLADEEGRIDLERLQRVAKRAHDTCGKLNQSCVHHRRVLALDQPDAADLVGKCDLRLRVLGADNLGGPVLLRAVERREDRGNRDGFEALGGDVAGDAGDLRSRRAARSRARPPRSRPRPCRRCGRWHPPGRAASRSGG